MFSATETPVLRERLFSKTDTALSYHIDAVHGKLEPLAVEQLCLLFENCSD